MREPVARAPAPCGTELGRIAGRPVVGLDAGRAIGRAVGRAGFERAGFGRGEVGLLVDPEEELVGRAELGRLDAACGRIGFFIIILSVDRQSLSK